MTDEELEEKQLELYKGAVNMMKKLHIGLRLQSIISKDIAKLYLDLLSQMFLQMSNLDYLIGFADDGSVAVKVSETTPIGKDEITDTQKVDYLIDKLSEVMTHLSNEAARGRTLFNRVRADDQI